MKNKIKIFRKLVRCASIALLSFSMAGCGADFLDTTPTNNISGSSIWTKATLAEQAVIGVYNVFLDQYCPNSGILDSHRIPWDAYSSVMDTDKNWIKRMLIVQEQLLPQVACSVIFINVFILLSIVLMM